ncbi:PQQ-binding-like beta-propeller repeat protein [Alloacidobacterium sp.]|uniref:outer membrane protein assembly factor BamB family protein n=1 Tax=Alloacidobacterium sp. TaxID=2951999 RepID=UPI002D24AC04|nr:PQQ-binding-like beta-propeller repeat protein [Alloacidobacterium sp.]HYK36730.1 PQQ-binding-like beta-propeller repeat protein [Alloacidobacterium sp.]
MLVILPLWLMLATANTSAHAQATSSPGDWTQFLRDNMQRWNPYETVLGVSNAESLQLKWKIGPYYTLSNIQSSPAVVNGVVYFGSDDHNLYAVNASTGARLWTYTTGGFVNSSPAVVNGVVYFGSGDDNVYALNASTGALLWKQANGGSGAFSPAVVNGVVYIGCGQSLCALNASTGAELWTYTSIVSFVTALSASPPAVVNGVVYFGADDGYVYALNASTGAKLWSSLIANGVYSSPAVANGVVFISGSSSVENTLHALNANTGAQLWSSKVGPNEGTVAVANGVVYVCSGFDGMAYALSASTGAKLWSFATGGPLENSSPAVANGVVYLAGGDSVYALNASTGAQLWRHAVDGVSGFLISSPTVVDGVVYIGAGASDPGQGYVYAFTPVSGSADLFLRIQPSATTVHQGDLLTFAFPVWNLGPDVAEGEVLSNLQVPAGTTFDYVRISGTPGLGTCTHPPYGGTGQIICHEGDGMAPNTTWTVRLTVKVTAPAGTVITESAATLADTPDPNMANNTATVSLTVQ